MEDEKLIPVSETPFAKDASFGYSHSDLKKWIEEKTKGRIKADEVGSLSSTQIGNEGETYVVRMLRKPMKTWIANASSMKEITVLSSACKQLEKEGLRILYRTAASFVQGYVEVDKKPLLAVNEIRDLPLLKRKKNGGFVIVGSYVPKTTEQLYHLLRVPGVYSTELEVDELFFQDQAQLKYIIKSINDQIFRGKTVVLYTSRKLRMDSDPIKNLSIGNQFSETLVKIVQNLNVRPYFLIAKGGITSSDVASKGLNVKKAKIVGQALPGVPVWRLGDESRFPGLPYIVFPGNVGEPRALEKLVSRLLEIDIEKHPVL